MYILVNENDIYMMILHVNNNTWVWTLVMILDMFTWLSKVMGIRLVIAQLDLKRLKEGHDLWSYFEYVTMNSYSCLWLFMAWSQNYLATYSII